MNNCLVSLAKWAVLMSDQSADDVPFYNEDFFIRLCGGGFSNPAPWDNHLQEQQHSALIQWYENQKQEKNGDMAETSNDAID